MTNQDSAVEANRLLGLSTLPLEWLGVWTPPGRHPHGLQRAVAYSIVVFNWLAAFASAGQLLYDPPSDTDRFRETIFLFFVTIAWSVRILSFLLQTERLQRLILTLLDTRKRFPDYSGVRQSYSRHAHLLTIWWQGLCIGPVLLWSLDPYILSLQQAQELNVTNERQLVIWLPINTSHSPRYEIVYFFDAVISFTMAELSVLFDIFLPVLIILVTAELAVLNENITMMTLTTMHEKERKSDTDEKSPALFEQLKFTNTSSWPNDVLSELPAASKARGEENPLLSYQDDNISSKLIYSNLVKNIQHHQITISCIKEMESVVSVCCYLILVINAIDICVQAFGLVELFQGSDQKRTSAMKKLLSLPLYISQTGLYCIYGQAVSDQSEQLRVSAFNCGWPDADKRFCNALHIFMLQTSRPLEVTVGKLLILSKHTFIQLINTSYTVFNMMLTV